jgi:hypothetical protein
MAIVQKAQTGEKTSIKRSQKYDHLKKIYKIKPVKALKEEKTERSLKKNREKNNLIFSIDRKILIRDFGLISVLIILVFVGYIIYKFI